MKDNGLNPSILHKLGIQITAERLLLYQTYKEVQCAKQNETYQICFLYTLLWGVCPSL